MEAITIELPLWAHLLVLSACGYTIFSLVRSLVKRDQPADALETLETVTRVEVIDKSGRAYVKMNTGKVQLSMQDRDKTLKVFISN